MNFNVISTNNLKVAIVSADESRFNTLQDAIDLMGSCYFEGISHIIIHEESLMSEFFDLKSGIAGEILQKFSTYNMNLAIIGDFSKHKSNSLQKFIYESNKTRRILFVSKQSEAIELWEKHYQN